ncbi:MAG: T9SS type A sorting domain-containing protein, partial [Bacteroidota bacterium]
VLATSMSIAPGQSFIDTLRFTPAVTGSASAEIFVTSNAPSSPDTIRVGGNGQSLIDIVNSQTSVANQFGLNQNYPNPFNPSTTISFTLGSPSFVTVRIYNLVGEVVKTLVSGRRSAGNYQVEWNANHIASGVYFCRMEAGGYAFTQKIVLMK